jgi:Holliday junction resolvase RusA-like endonuclease
MPVTKKPDLDNVLKAIKDGCNRVIWADDCQCTQLIASKVFSDRPRVEVEVREVA